MVKAPILHCLSSCQNGGIASHVFLFTCNQSRCTYSQCMPRVHLNDLWTDRQHVWITVSRCGTHAFGGSRPCATRWWQTVHWKSSRKGVRFWTPHQTKEYGRFSRRPFFALLATALSYSSILLQTSQGSGCILALYLYFCCCVSLLSLSFSLSSLITGFFFPFWCRNNETASTATALEMMNLR